MTVYRIHWADDARPPTTVRTLAGDHMAWEAWASRKGLPLMPAVGNLAGGDASKATVDVTRFPVETHELFLAWRAATRAEHPDRPKLDDWAMTVAEVEETEKDENPTRPAATPELSAT